MTEYYGPAHCNTHAAGCINTSHIFLNDVGGYIAHQIYTSSLSNPMYLFIHSFPCNIFSLTRPYVPLDSPITNGVKGVNDNSHLVLDCTFFGDMGGNQSTQVKPK